MFIKKLNDLRKKEKMLNLTSIETYSDFENIVNNLKNNLAKNFF